jgi:hypothetical protein
MNVRKLILLVLVVLLLTGCQLGKKTPTEQPKEPVGTAYPAMPTQQPAASTGYPAPVEQPTAANPANLYPAFKEGDQIAWNQAAALIANGEVMKIIAAPSLQVTLFLKDGRSLVTQQPAEGELQKVLDACGEACKDIEVVNQ